MGGLSNAFAPGLGKKGRHEDERKEAERDSHKEKLLGTHRAPER